MAVCLDCGSGSISGRHVFDRHLSLETLIGRRHFVIDEKLIEQLKRNIEDWNEQARLWESKGDADLANQCRTKAKQWAEVVTHLKAKEHS